MGNHEPTSLQNEYKPAENGGKREIFTDTVVMAPVYRLILVLIHWIISSRDWLVGVFRLMMKLARMERDPGSIKDIKGNVAHLRRLPVHLGIVVVEEDLNIVDIAKIAVWAMAAGIYYITIYDQKGHCKKNRDAVLQKLQEQQRQLHGDDTSFSAVKPSSYVDGSPDKEFSPMICGGCQRQSPSIQIVGPEDGRQHLVNITKWLSRQIANHEITKDSIDVPYVDAAVREKFSFPDPDLVMKFGTVESLLGFFPWQTRLSEILSLPTHRRIDFSSFLAALERFGYTEQRFGK